MIYIHSVLGKLFVNLICSKCLNIFCFLYIYFLWPVYTVALITCMIQIHNYLFSKEHYIGKGNILDYPFIRKILIWGHLYYPSVSNCASLTCMFLFFFGHNLSIQTNGNWWRKRKNSYWNTPVHQFDRITLPNLLLVFNPRFKKIVLNIKPIYMYQKDFNFYYYHH